MISLDQVLLLQKKVETAVEKIGTLTGENTQLKSENDALRSKCAELTKALSEKTELVSTLESQQGQIEQGILSALNRLSTVENSVLNAAGSSSSEVKNENHSDKQADTAPAEHREPVAERSEPVAQHSEPAAEPKAAAQTEHRAPVEEHHAPAADTKPTAPKSNSPEQLDIF